MDIFCTQSENWILSAWGMVKILEKFIIHGGVPLIGEISAGGSKNSALGVLTAALMTKSVCVFRNIPDIEDIQLLLNIFESLGVKYERYDSVLKLDTRNISKTTVDIDDAMKMRASYYLLGAFLGRFGKVDIPFPGGCNIGARPIDQHIKGFKALGAEIYEDDEKHRISAFAQKLNGNAIYFDCVSVGATINVMMAAVLADGTTEITNAAKEPHIVDVANFLNYMGAKIKGAGTDIIRIEGVKEFKHEAEYTVIPDQIEVGTYMIMAAATGGDVTIKNVIPKHMETLSAKLKEMGVDVKEESDAINIKRVKRLESADVKTAVYPGFPTDLQQPFSVLCTIADGESSIKETIYENRFKHLEELQNMGAIVNIKGDKAKIEGIETLHGAVVKASDLRAGAALVAAGLAADGITEVLDIEHIDRGYESIEKKLRKLGARIERVSE